MMYILLLVVGFFLCIYFYEKKKVKYYYPSIIYVIRHGEKEHGNFLDSKGKERAEKLIQWGA